MKIKDITVGQEVAVFFYGSANSMQSNKWGDKYSFAATKATVKEVGVHGTVYHNSRSIYGSKSATANYVVLDHNGREETVICTKIVGEWAEYEAAEIEKIEARLKREAEAQAARNDIDAELAALVKKLGVSEYDLPTLATGYGRNNYDPSVVASNKRKLVKVLKLALEKN